MQKIEKKVWKAVYKSVLSEINAVTENLTYLARQGGWFPARLTAGMKIKIQLTAEKWYGWLHSSIGNFNLIYASP